MMTLHFYLHRHIVRTMCPESHILEKIKHFQYLNINKPQLTLSYVKLHEESFKAHFKGLKWKGYPKKLIWSTGVKWDMGSNGTPSCEIWFSSIVSCPGCCYWHLVLSMWLTISHSVPRDQFFGKNPTF